MANPQALVKLEQTAIHKESFYRLRAEVGLRIANLNLSATALKLWIYLCSLFPFGDRESQMPTQGELALRLGVSRRTIIRASLELKDAALWDFRVQRWKGKNLTGYGSTPTPEPNDAGSDTDVRGCDMDVTGSDTDVRGCDMDVTGSDTDGTSHIYKDRAGAETIKTKKTDQTFSDGERERTVKEVEDPESEKAKQVKAQPTCSLPNPAQESVNSGEKFSAAVVAFQIPAEKKRGFYDALRQYAANHGARCPSAYAKAVMADLEQTGMCSLWDDFSSGLELGTSDRPSHEWLDPETGKPYPFLVRAVEEIAKAKSNDSVSAATEAAKIINNPKLCQPVWASVKRELLRYSKEAERMQRLGVQHTYLPPRYSDKPLEPALSEVKDAIASITPGRQKSLEKSEATPTPEVKSLEKSEATPTPEVKSLEKSEATPPPVAKSLEKSQMTPPPEVKSLEKSQMTPPPEVKSLEKSQMTPPPEVKSLEKSEMTPPPEAKSLEKSDSDRNSPAKSLEKSQMTPPPEVKSLEKSQTTLTPLAESLKNLDVILGNQEDKPKEIPVYESAEQRQRASEERINIAKQKALRWLKDFQIRKSLEEVNATLPTDPQERQAQLQIWMNDQHPYPAIAKRLIEMNYQWGLYLDGTRVLEEEF